MTKSEIREIREDVAKNLGEKEAGIFDAHMLVLEDRALIEDVKKDIMECIQICATFIIRNHYWKE